MAYAGSFTVINIIADGYNGIQAIIASTKLKHHQHFVAAHVRHGPSKAFKNFGSMNAACGQ